MLRQELFYNYFSSDDSIDSSQKLYNKGKLILKNAEIDFFLSVNKEDLPHKEWKPHRLITVDGKELEFSEGFTELHNKSYRNIIDGNGFGINDIKKTIDIIEKMNNNER